jgi:RNA polymerase sigma-70 factor, ECF subfamily
LPFEELYQTFFPVVWRTLRRLGVSERDVPDVAQRVFLIAYRKLDTFEGRSTETTWLYAIALRVASDYRKLAVHRRETYQDSPLELTDETNPETRLVQKERLIELDRILSQLPEEQRTVFVLYEFEELSGEQIANIVGVSEGTVRSRLRLARQTFSRMLTQQRQPAARLATAGER